MRVAALDLGSNTFLLLIAELDQQGRVQRVLIDECVVTRLSEGVNKTQRLGDQALQRAEKCLSQFSKIIKQHKVEKIQAVATSAARDAENSSLFFALAEKYKIPIEIISGQKEAELTYFGALGASPEKYTSVIDIGGGSTEIIGDTGSGIKAKSINIGSVRLTEKFISQHPVPKAELTQLQDYIKDQLQQNREDLPAKTNILVAVAGTPTTLAAMDLQIEFAADQVEAYILTRERLSYWIDKLAAMPISERLQVKGLSVGREDVIIAGMSILLMTMQFLHCEKVIVSTKGVRYG
ncbi:MAG: Ppx/GppA family phosphatase, partial [Bdellovibrionales bacterium]|nr:Ppx/GppA family phosphatase [Bdellovibrionales bacterium]